MLACCCLADAPQVGKDRYKRDGPKVIEALLKNPKTDVNAKDKNGDTALHIVAREGWTAAMDLLVADTRLDITVENSHHETAKKLAVRQDFNRMVEALGRLEKPSGGPAPPTNNSTTGSGSGSGSAGPTAAEWAAMKKLVKYLGKVVADIDDVPQKQAGNIREMLNEIGE